MRVYVRVTGFLKFVSAFLEAREEMGGGARLEVGEDLSGTRCGRQRGRGAGAQRPGRESEGWRGLVCFPASRTPGARPTLVRGPWDAPGEPEAHCLTLGGEGSVAASRSGVFIFSSSVLKDSLWRTTSAPFAQNPVRHFCAPKTECVCVFVRVSHFVWAVLATLALLQSGPSKAVRKFLKMRNNNPQKTNYTSSSNYTLFFPSCLVFPRTY